MCVLYRFPCTHDEKNPPHVARTAHGSHPDRYSFFQSEIDRRANAHTEGGRLQS
jgi:hypothetical protein